jgi:hypothetical protein
MMTVTAHMPIQRGDDEIVVEVSATYSPRVRGRRAHPMDRFAEPDDDACVEDILAHDSAGNVVDLTEDEMDEAIEHLFVAAEQEMAARQEERAEYRRER